MYELRPAGIIKPQGRAAFAAEMALTCTGMGAPVFRVLYPRTIDREVTLAGHLQGRGVAAQVDGVPAAALRLAADAAVATLIGIHMARAQPKLHCAAMTGSLE